MPARNTDVTLSTTAPTLLTDGAVAACRVSNKTGYVVLLQATATTTAPTSRAGGVPLMPSATAAADLTLADLFPGIGAGAMYLWAYADGGGAVSVSHA